MPVADAVVVPESPSFNYQPVVTDENGKADIPRSLQEVEWLSISATGSKVVKRVAFKRGKSIRVTYP